MLVVTRKEGETCRCRQAGVEVEVEILRARGGKVRLVVRQRRTEKEDKESPPSNGRNLERRE